MRFSAFAALLWLVVVAVDGHTTLSYRRLRATGGQARGHASVNGRDRGNAGLGNGGRETPTAHGRHNATHVVATPGVAPNATTVTLSGTAVTIMEDHFDTGDHYMNHVLTVDGSGESVIVAGLPHDFQFRGSPHVTLVAHSLPTSAANAVYSGRKHPAPIQYVCGTVGARGGARGAASWAERDLY